MKLWSNGPSGKKSGFGKTNRNNRRSRDHSRSSRLKYNLNRVDLENGKRKLKRHIAEQPNDICAKTAWQRAGYC